MVGQIIGFIILGAVIGALARLALPGKQNISAVVTVILGALGALIAGFIVSKVGYSNASGGIPWLAYLASVIVSALLIIGYGKVMAGKSSPL